MERPKLRPGLQAIPLQHEGETVVMINDLTHLSPDYVAPLPVYMLLTLMDGSRDVPGLEAAFSLKFGQLFPIELIREVIRLMDERLLLDNARSTQAREELVQGFTEAAVRPAAHAGGSYPADGRDLEEQLAGFFSSGPGHPDGSVLPDLAGVLAPHIDLRCGGPTIAHAYRALAEGPPFERAVILGIGHHAFEGGPFIVCKKDFETPLGRLEVDREFVEFLERACGPGIFTGEFAHKHEHSVEFQVVFLQYICRNLPQPPRIVPVLCGSFHEWVESKSSPAAAPEVSRFITALQEAARALPGRTVFVAGVDLSHFGPKFGHERAADEAFVAEVAERDREILATVEQGDPEGFWQSVVRDGNTTNVCGYPAIYTLMKTLGKGRGKLLAYQTNVEPPTSSAVSYASVSYHV